MIRSSLATSITNGVIYQLGWFACVLGAARGWGVEGASVALALTLLHLLLAESPEREIPLLVTAGMIGITVDSLHAGFGVLRFNGHEAGTLAPLWIIALWIQFGTVLHFCMNWLSRKYALASFLGLIGGPLSFLAGERMGAATFGDPRLLSLAILAASWSIALPTLVYVADRLGGPGSYRPFPDATSAASAARNA